MLFRSGGKSEPFTYDGPVEIYGLIYLFNPPLESGQGAAIPTTAGTTPGTGTPNS